MIPEKLGKYEIRGTLGRGAMGQVYDGWDPLIHRQVAIKTVRLADAGDEQAADGLARFRREAQAAGRLSHPNIVGVYDFGETDEAAYIVMEYVPGGSLKEVLDRREPQSAAWVCGIMAQVLAGLAYSHARAVVHRDIKPANVMLGADGTAKLADFGIARIESGDATSVGTIMGTPSYMAPEQFLGEEADARSDIYAAGAMLFHLLTGSRPYEGNPSAIMHKVLNASSPPKASERVAGLPASLDPVLARAMARRREDRFQDAAAFSIAMSTALSGQAADAQEERTVILRPTPGPDREVSSPTFRQSEGPGAMRWEGEGIADSEEKGKARLWFAAAGSIIILVGGTGAWLLTSPTGRRPQTQSAPVMQPAASPAPVKLPPQSAAELASALNESIAAIPCALAHASVMEGGPALSGSVGEGEPEAALRAVSGMQARKWLWQIGTVPASFCGALASLHEAAASGLVTISLRAARIAKSKGKIHLHPSISGIAFPSYLRVDYLSAGGSVYHVYPHVAQADTQEVEDPPVMLAPQAALGLGTEPHQALEMLPPFDGDLILAVASNHPLLPDRRPNTELAAPYLAALRDAISQARKDGWMLAAGAASLKALR